MKTYTIQESLLQAIVSYLLTKPAGETRTMLNTLEAECLRQDAEKKAAAEAALRDRIRAELATGDA